MPRLLSTAAQETVSDSQPVFIARHRALTPNPSPDSFLAGEGRKNDN